MWSRNRQKNRQKTDKVVGSAKYVCRFLSVQKPTKPNRQKPSKTDKNRCRFTTQVPSAELRRRYRQTGQVDFQGDKFSSSFRLKLPKFGTKKGVKFWTRKKLEREIFPFDILQLANKISEADNCISGLVENATCDGRGFPLT